MAPPPVVGMDILNDPAYTVAADSHGIENVEPVATPHSSPLRTISSSNTHNRRPKPVSRVESLTAQLEKLHIGDSHQVTPCKGKALAKTKAQPGARVTRPPVTANTFVPLETVAERDEQADVAKPDPAAVSRERPRYIELPVDRYAQHPLAIAASTSPSAAEQFAKQRNGDFDWVLTVKPPTASESNEVKRLFFGCNLLPVPARSGNDASSKEEPRSYTLLATPLEGNEEPLVDSSMAKETTMALAEAPKARLAPAKTGDDPLPVVRVEECTPAVINVRDGDGSPVPVVDSKLPAKEVEGIEAIDQFEEEMEAFELAAGIKTVTSSSMGMAKIRSPGEPTLSLTPVPRRDRTPAPQPERPMPTANASKTRSGRRPSSMILLDSPKLKGEDKALAQACPKKTPSKASTSLQPPRPLARSGKAPTVAAFELPGEAVARRPEEQRDARRASQRAQSQPVQDGGDTVVCRLGEKQAARQSTKVTQIAEPKPRRPRAGRVAILTTDVAPLGRKDDSDEFMKIVQEHQSRRLTPPTRSAQPTPTGSEDDSDEFMKVVREHQNRRLTPPTRSAQPTPTGSEDADDEFLKIVREHQNRRLTPPTRSAQPTPTGSEDDRDDFLKIVREHQNRRLTPPTRSAQPTPTGPEDAGDDEFMKIVREHHNRRLTPPTWDAQPDPPKPTGSLRRAKSTKAPTLPKFELPGEAISRRKREEQEARRKAQEEEERKRRQFKARPVRSAAAPSTVPRETIASRARLNSTLFEKPAQPAPMQNKRASVGMDTRPRGRHLVAAMAGQAGPQASRATSSSADSTGKRSSVSLEEAKQQRVRGKDIFQRDSAFSQDRTKERRERETMARIAREEAAERSRQKSREWAEKQKRKRMTVGSMRDVTGPQGLPT